MMKYLKVLLVAFMFLIFPGIVKADGISVNKTNMNVYLGSSATFNITAASSAGKITVASQNSGIATVNRSTEWIENQTLSVTITGKSLGTTKVTVTINDAATFGGQKLSGTYTINVNVIERPTTTTTAYQEVLELNNLKIVGYKIDFNKEIYEYNLNISSGINELYIETSTRDDAVITEGNGIVNVEGKDSIIIKIINTKTTNYKEYKINLIRDDQEPLLISKVENKTTPSKEVDYTKFILLGISVIELVVIIILAIKKR